MGAYLGVDIGGTSVKWALVEQRKAYTGPLDAMPLPRVTRATLGNDANLYGAVQEARKLQG